MLCLLTKNEQLLWGCAALINSIVEKANIRPKNKPEEIILNTIKLVQITHTQQNLPQKYANPHLLWAAYS